MKIPPPSEQVEIYPFADGLVLHRSGSHELHAVNSVAAVIWCLLPEVSSREELLERLVNDHGFDPEPYESIITKTLGEFSALGLLEGSSASKNDRPSAYRF